MGYSPRTVGIIWCLVGASLGYIFVLCFLVLIAVILKFKKPRDVLANKLRSQEHEADAVRLNQQAQQSAAGGVYRQFTTLSTNSDDPQGPSSPDVGTITSGGYKAVYYNPALQLDEGDAEFTKKRPTSSSYA